MSVAIITAGGIGDCLMAVQAATLYQSINLEPVEIWVNSHQEIVDFINKCTYFPAFKCPEHHNKFHDPENPLNLPKDFLDGLFTKHTNVWSAFPDSLGQCAFAFPWYRFCKNYKAFLRTKIHVKQYPRSFENLALNPDTKNIFIHATSITLEKNYQMTKLQKLVNMLNTTNYNVIICRTSEWKGTPLPFFCQGKYYDLVDEPIDKVIYTLRKSDYFIGIDSGPAHVAYHLDVPRIVLHNNFNIPMHLVRYHEDSSDDLPLNVEPEVIFNRVMLNLKDPLTYAIPSYLTIPHNANTKQLLFKKYYD
jgi:hypothetical protein